MFSLTAISPVVTVSAFLSSLQAVIWDTMLLSASPKANLPESVIPEIGGTGCAGSASGTAASSGFSSGVLQLRVTGRTGVELGRKHIPSLTAGGPTEAQGLGELLRVRCQPVFVGISKVPGPALGVGTVVGDEKSPPRGQCFSGRRQ